MKLFSRFLSSLLCRKEIIEVLQSRGIFPMTWNNFMRIKHSFVSLHFSNSRLIPSDHSTPPVLVCSSATSTSFTVLFNWMWFRGVLFTYSSFLLTLVWSRLYIAVMLISIYWIYVSGVCPTIFYHFPIVSWYLFNATTSVLSDFIGFVPVFFLYFLFCPLIFFSSFRVSINKRFLYMSL